MPSPPAAGRTSHRSDTRVRRHRRHRCPHHPPPTPAPTEPSWSSPPPAAARHRPHARVEDYIRTGKDTGLGYLPSTSIDINRAWCVAATIACDLLCWLRLLCLDGPLATAEPKTSPPPASSAANANARSASPTPGPGRGNWPPACSPRSHYPHRPEHDRPRPRPRAHTGPVEPGTPRRDSRPPPP